MTYSSLELIEIFNLDPELELYNDRPTQPPPNWTPNSKLIARLRDSARNITARITEDIKQGKSGRHRGLMSYAMLLRENGADSEIAQELMKYFCDRLPPRGEQPVPFEEAQGAMTWVAAKEAGRNPPMHRPTGLENIAIASGDQGNAPGGNSGERDDLDEVTRASARAPITIQAGGYARVKDTKDGPTFTQLTNWTFTPNLDLVWPDGSTGHRGALAINTTRRHTLDLPIKAWASRRDLLAQLGQYGAFIFTNSNSDVGQIGQFILTNTPDLPTATGVTTYGLHHIDGVWEQLYEDTNHPKIFYVGTPVDPGPAYRSLTPSPSNDIDRARETIALLPNLITPAAALALLGYGMASAYAPRITPELGDRLPFLYLTGERESGKSSSIELVLTLTTGHPSARLRKAPGLTPYQYDSSFANMNNRLAALDEYRPGSIDDAQLRKHHDLGVKWRGSGIAAKDHAYILNSPLTVAGEGFTEDAAALSRGPLYLIAKADRGDVDTYLRAQAAPNHAYAYHLANAAANLTQPAHTARFEHARTLAKQATESRGGPRLQFALTYIAYGLLHLQDDGLHDLITDHIIQRALETGVLQTLDGGNESKTSLEIFLEQLGVAVGEAKDPRMYIVPGFVPNTIIIRRSASVEVVKRRYPRDAAIPNAKLLRQYAQKLDWVDASSTHKGIGGVTVRGIKIDLNQTPDRCDLGALAYLEEKLRGEYR